jgi:hypothetical protein
MRHYGVPLRIISLNRKIVHPGQLSDSFKVKTEVCQSFPLSPFLFLLVID